jgi:Tfp pilus assembly protein PilF
MSSKRSVGRKTVRVAVYLAAFAMILSPAAALAKAPKAPAQTTPAPGQLTTTDLRTCMGLNGSKAPEQITACTKIINSGKVKHPFEADYYATRGSAYLHTHQLALALADITKALSIRQSPEFYFERAVIHIASKHLDLAKTDLAEVMRQKPAFAPAYMMRGLISYMTGDYSDAVPYFDKAVQHQPSYYQAIFARGVAKQKAGDKSGGERDVAEARGMSTHVDADLAKFGVVPD